MVGTCETDGDGSDSGESVKSKPVVKRNKTVSGYDLTGRHSPEVMYTHMYHYELCA